jgi:hypothetical protein
MIVASWCTLADDEIIIANESLEENFLFHF